MVILHCQLLEKIANILEIEISELFAPSNHEESIMRCPNCGAKLELKKAEDCKKQERPATYHKQPSAKN